MRILIAGPPCSGKSTLARQLAQLHNAEVIDFDLIAVALGSPDPHDHPPEIKRRAEAEYQSRLACLSGPAVVVRSAPERSDRESLADAIGANRVIVLDVSADEAKRRAVATNRPSWTADAIDRWWRKYQPSPPEGDPKPQEGTMPETEETETEEFDEERAKAKIAKANAEAANLRKRAKEAEDKLATLESRIEELDGKDKSEVEKLSTKLAETERKAQEAEQRAMRAEVAASKGLTPAQAKRLHGSSLEELEADADELLESFKPQEGANLPVLERKPTEDLRGGTDPTVPALNGDPILQSVKSKLGI